MKKNVFISYSSLDAGKVKTLFTKMKKESALDPIVVEFDKSPMQYLEAKVVEKLSTADYFVPIITRNSLTAQYMNQEIGFAHAKKIKTIPIVEKELISELKGFITSQNDLSFTFRNFGGNKKRERAEYRTCCDLVTSFIIKKIETKTKTKKEVTLSDIFKGKWINNYSFPDGRTGSEPFEIKNDNEYYLDGKYMFKLDKILISKDKKSIRFRKNGVNKGDNRKAMNILDYKKPGVYAGDEEGNVVIYSKWK